MHAGASGVGSAAIQIARLLGARVFTTVGSPEKIDHVCALGATDVILYREQDFSDRIRTLTAKRGVDVVLDHVGATTWERNVRALVRGGRLVVSHLEDPFQHVLSHHLTLRWSSASMKYGELPSDFQRQFEVEEAWITPLLADRECLGLLIVDNKFNNMPVDLAEDKQELLSTFANLAAMAITQDRRRKAEHSRLEIAETFREISRILGSTLDIDQVLDSALEQMDRVLPYNTASMQWLDDTRKNLQIIRARGFPDDREVEKLSFDLDKDFPNVKVFHQKMVIRYDDIQQVYELFSAPSYYVEKARSWLGVPLR